MNRTTFYNEKDYIIDMKMTKEYITTDSGLHILLFSLNMVNSKKDIYGESLPEEKQFLEPVKLGVYIEIKPTTMEKIGEVFTNETMDEVKFGLFNDELIEKNVDPKRGDFILYDDNTNKRFFEINTITNITSNNSMNGFKPFYKSVTSSYVRDYILPEGLKNYI